MLSSPWTLACRSDRARWLGRALVIGTLLFTCAHAQDVQYSVSEEGQVPSFIGNVPRDINLQALAQVVFPKLQYSILTGSGSSGDLFSVDSSTGDLYTARRLDRETLCRFSALCQLDVRVGAVFESYFKNVRVRINLQDVNDNAPRFNRSSLALGVSEAATVGTTFTLEGALDEDTGANNSVQNYFLSPSDVPFGVSFTRLLDGTSNVILKVTKPLDREVTSAYSLRLVAADGGVPLRSAELLLSITISDSNDNAPVFTQTSYSARIGENVRPGERIVTVTARDVDDGVNALLRYRLSPNQDANIASLFSIGAASGEVSVQQLPASGAYSLIVQAEDGGSPPKEAQAVVQIEVVDTINDPPRIAVTLLNPTVPEDLRVRSPVAHVAVEDPDTGNNGQVICFSQSAYFDVRALPDSPDMMVELAQPLDREEATLYRVTVYCHDGGSPQLNATAAFVVSVDDVNDNPPVFAQTNVTVTFPEGDRVGDVVASLTATDRDSGQNGRLTYSLLTSLDAFYVTEIGGAVVVSKPLDRERQGKYVLTVAAVDSGQPRLSATATLTILLQDVNDEAPVFGNDSYVYALTENQPPGLLVATFSATDPDLGEGGKVSFYLGPARSQAVTAAFLLHPNGTLVTRAALDREVTSEVVFDVIASDNGTPRLTSWQKVRVVVTDENDNRPVWTFPGAGNYTLTLLLPVPRDKHLLRLSVTDADEGANGELTFAWDPAVPANLSALFSLDPWVGDVWARQALGDGQQQQQQQQQLATYNLTFVATDRGRPPLSSSCSLALTLRWGADFAPAGPGDDQLALVVGASVAAAAAVVVLVVVVVIIVVCRRRASSEELKYVSRAKGDGSGSEGCKDGVVGQKQTTSSGNSKSPDDGHKDAVKEGDPHTQGLRSSDLFYTPASNKGRCYGDLTPQLSLSPEMRSRSPISPKWSPDLLEFDVDREPVEAGLAGGDLQALNRETSLRLQQAFQHISALRSHLVTPTDTDKPYEWREIHVPGRPEDYSNSLSSGITTATSNGDSGIGNDDDVFLLPSHHHHHHHQQQQQQHQQLPPPYKHNPHNPYHQQRQQPPHRSNQPSQRDHHHPRPARISGNRAWSQPPSENSHDRSHQSCSSLPNFYPRPGSSGSLVFRPNSATSCESSPSADDYCTTTSGSYSLDPDPPGMRGAKLGNKVSDRSLDSDYSNMQDVYV